MVPSLIAGPRGRRLVLELAGRYDDDVRAAANDLALLYDLGRGAGTAVFGWAGGRPLTQGQIEEEVVRRAPTLPDFARALGNVAFPKEGPTPGEFHEAMTATVGDAMYWEPPQGADVLASAPELAAALGEVAARVAPHAPRWWSHPMHPDQHALAWYDSPLAPPLTPARWGEATRAEERRARREYPAHLGAGVSGTWWS